MVKTGHSGIRKLHFKDWGNEQTGAATAGTLWESPAAATWSIGLGSGASVRTYKGTGYRHLVTATNPNDLIYTINKPAGAWFDTVQKKQGKQYQCQYDVGFRVGTLGGSLMFGWLIEHGGSPTFVESKGYRVVMNGTTLSIEKLNTAGGIMTWTAIGGDDFVLEEDQDYYMRITYIPEDYTNFSIDVEAAGTIIVEISDDFDTRGSGDTFKYGMVDPASPLAGGDNTKLMVGATLGVIGGEFWGITYSEGFLWRPEYVHYFGSMKEIKQILTFKLAMPTQELIGVLSNGNRIECWTKENHWEMDIVTGNTTKKKKYCCIFDGMVVRIEPNGTDGLVTYTAVDEFTAAYMQRKETHSIPEGYTYYQWIINYWNEQYDPTINLLPKRLTGFSGFDNTHLSLSSVSTAYDLRGRDDVIWKLFCAITNSWMWWNPITATVVMQLNPVATSRGFDLSTIDGEWERVLGVDRIDAVTGQRINRLNQFHDDGAGAVTTTVQEDTADQDLYGHSSDSHLDLGLPPTEGAAVAENRFNQQSDLNPMFDVVTAAFGSDLHVGCQVFFDDPSKDIDSEHYTIVEKELIFQTKNAGNVPSSIIRFRIAYQETAVGVADTLPRFEVTIPRLLKEKMKELDYVDHNWGP